MNKNQFLTRFQNAQQLTPEPDYPLPHEGKPASVLIPLIDHPTTVTVLFTVRALHLKHHAGQISFPGGKQETEDANLLATALRESQEEIGLNGQKISIVGCLPKYRTISGYEVLPYIGFVDPQLDLQLDANEVDSVFEVPLAFLLDKRNHLVHWVKRNDNKHPIYFIYWQGKTIWGATAAFVRNLANICD